LGKHSGKSALKYKLGLMNIPLNKEEFEEVYFKIKNLGDLGKYISDIDLKTVINEVKGHKINEKIILNELTVVSGNKITPLASIKLDFANEVGGESKSIIETAYGVGPVDASINALRKALSGFADISLIDYQVSSIGKGTDALVEVVVKLRRGNEVVEVKKSQSDIIRASVEAVMEGINLLI